MSWTSCWLLSSMGRTGNKLPADVNADGIVNVQDLIAVAAGVDAPDALPIEAVEQALLMAEAQAADIEAIAGAPVGFATLQRTLFTDIAYGNVTAALADVKLLAAGNAPSRKKAICAFGASAAACRDGCNTRNNGTTTELSEPFQPRNMDTLSLGKGCGSDIHDPQCPRWSDSEVNVGTSACGYLRES